ncbi:LicD family protein [Methanobrevibacter sp.]|uniref:LicD family protein n=1 Tax=Methanobrevibacter sp. TaxID=66852 RepID=UPI0025F5643C|nr:LicD family protein [Methanobrevibacter sp.]MBQ2666497.1 LicD family protein [Methanobrevibacter sp.]
MSLEDYYFKLPDFIKFNPKILKLSFDITDRLKKANGVSPQDYLLELSLESDEIKEFRRKFHVLYAELLIFIDNVAEKHGIDYWLGFGSLLGAVRHGGFIPWDDDIDLVALRNDYNKFIEVLPTEIEKYNLKEHCGLTLLLENRKNYFDGFNSVYDIRDKSGEHIIDGKYNFLQIAWLRPYIKIDIFPYDFLLDDDLENFSDKFTPVQYKFYHDLLNNKVKFHDELKSLRKKVGFTDSKTKHFSETFEGIPHWKIKIFDYDKIFPLSSIEFEGLNFKSPKDCDHYLTQLFGPNYMEFPEVIENHDTFAVIKSQFNSKEEMDESFDDAIKFLRNVNEIFE